MSLQYISDHILIQKVFIRLQSTTLANASYGLTIFVTAVTDRKVVLCSAQSQVGGSVSQQSKQLREVNYTGIDSRLDKRTRLTHAADELETSSSRARACNCG